MGFYLNVLNVLCIADFLSFTRSSQDLAMNGPSKASYGFI